MRVNFMGLTGPLGVLPLPYSALVVDRMRERDTSMRDFFDIFNHRMISLFYQAWEKYRFTIAYERGERDRFSHHLLALIGLGTPGLQDLKPEGVPDDSLLFYSGLLSMHPRSARRAAAGAAGLLSSAGGDRTVRGRVASGGRGIAVFPGRRCHVFRAPGFGAVVGDEIWDQQSRVRIRLGPLTLDQYQDFLPGAKPSAGYASIAGFFSGDEYDLELQLVLKRTEVPRCELSRQGPPTGMDKLGKIG